LSLTDATSKNPKIGNFSFSTYLDLAFSKNEPPFIKGSIDLKNILYKKDIDIATAIIGAIKSTSVEKIETEKKKQRAAELNINVTGSNNIRIENNIVETGVSLITTVSGTLDDPKIEGDIKLVEGKFYFQGHKFDIDHGTISLYTDSDPYFDIVAKTSYEADNCITFTDQKFSGLYDITLYASGNDLSKKSIRLESSPVLEREADIWLLFTCGGDIFPGIGSISDVVGINEAVKSNFGFTRFNLKPIFSDETGKLEPKIVAVKEITPFLDLSFELSPNNPKDQSIELKYKGNLFDSNMKWSANSDFDREWGKIGFDVNLRYVYE